MLDKIKPYHVHACTCINKLPPCNQIDKIDKIIGGGMIITRTNKLTFYGHITEKYKDLLPTATCNLMR